MAQALLLLPLVVLGALRSQEEDWEFLQVHMEKNDVQPHEGEEGEELPVHF